MADRKSTSSRTSCRRMTHFTPATLIPAHTLYVSRSVRNDWTSVWTVHWTITVIINTFLMGWNFLWYGTCMGARSIVMVFSSLERILRESLTIHSYLVLFFFFFSGSQLAQTNSTFLGVFFCGQDQPTMAMRAETTLDKCSLISCMWVHFPDRSPHYACTGSRVYAWLGVTCHLRFWQSDRPGSFTCHCRLSDMDTE